MANGLHDPMLGMVENTVLHHENVVDLGYPFLPPVAEQGLDVSVDRGEPALQLRSTVSIRGPLQEKASDLVTAGQAGQLSSLSDRCSFLA